MHAFASDRAAHGHEFGSETDAERSKFGHREAACLGYSQLAGTAAGQRLLPASPIVMMRDGGFSASKPERRSARIDLLREFRSFALSVSIAVVSRPRSSVPIRRVNRGC